MLAGLLAWLSIPASVGASTQAHPMVAPSSTAQRTAPRRLVRMFSLRFRVWSSTRSGLGLVIRSRSLGLPINRPGTRHPSVGDMRGTLGGKGHAPYHLF